NIGLLNGTFTGVQFQVGANEGQTLSLSIQNTSANTLGLNQSTGSATSRTYGSKGGLNGVLSLGTLDTPKAGSTASAIGTAGAFTAASGTTTITTGKFSYTGANGNTATISGFSHQASAASLATKVNNNAGTTGVTAQAVTSVTLKAANATAGSGFDFKIQGSGTAQTINAANVSALAAQINGQTGSTGISATLNTSGSKVTLTQANGKNISFTGVTHGSLTSSASGVTAATLSSTNASGVVQGKVQLQSSAAFSVASGSHIGLAKSSTLTSLSQINVSTASGANTAINVVKFALQGLNNQGGQLGAVQQRLSANINNLNTSSQNVTSALGVVQDANIPQVSNRLTQSQIQAQAGVAALKSSTTLQQSYLSLLP
nr:flagellin [Pseudomonadota bacterium]